MPFADILLRVDPTAENELERLALAVDLAQRLHGRLDGVFMAAGEASKANWARTLFMRAVSRSPLETTWRVLDGHSDAALLFQARRSDLLILPGGGGAGAVGGVRGETYAAERVAMDSGRPTLILPAGAAASIGNITLVGWSDTRASARSIHDAMPLLLMSEKVVVVTVVADDELEPLADRRFAEHLRQHGLAAEFRRRQGDPAEEIAAEARELGADLLVIGLAGERAGTRIELGDVSQKFARTTSLPVFCSV
jgi:nucleotide-binding universal stress UspA family protein